MRFGSADRLAFEAFTSELAVVDWFRRHEFRVVAIEAEQPDGKRPDVLIATGDEEIAIEVTTPRPADADWADSAIGELFEKLRRVPTGLYIDVRGFDVLRFEPGGAWGEPNPPISSAQIDETIEEFRKAVANLDVRALPAVVVSPRPGQPLRIEALEWVPEYADMTAIVTSWDRSGLRPDVDRLASILLAKRDQLPRIGPSLIVCDLITLSDFRHAEYYLGQVSERLKQRSRLPSAVATFVTRTEAPDVLIERSILATASPTPGVDRLLDAWLPGR
ncbi:MAG: hypothetical protein ACRDQT_08215 [Gaiellaceae bacterium]